MFGRRENGAEEAKNQLEAEFRERLAQIDATYTARNRIRCVMLIEELFSFLENNPFG